MKIKFILCLALVFSLCVIAMSCGKANKFKPIVEISEKDSKFVLTVNFGSEYASRYVSVTVTKGGENVYFSQIQLDFSGCGGDDFVVNTPGDYTLTVVSGDITKTISFSKGDK